MEKARPLVLVVAIVLTFLYLQSIAPPVQKPPLQQKVTQADKKKAGSSPSLQSAPLASTKSTTTPFPVSSIKVVDDIVLANEQAKIVLSNKGAVIKTIELEKYFEDVKNTIPLLLVNNRFGSPSFATRLLQNAPLQPWSIVTRDTTSVTFSRPDATGLVLTKVIALQQNGDIHIRTTITNPTENAIAIAPILDGPAGVTIEPGSLLGSSSKPFVYGIADDDSIELEDADLKEIKEDGYSRPLSRRLKWFSLRSKYFVAAAMVDDPSLYDQIIASYISAGAGKNIKESIKTSLIATTINLAPQQSSSYNFTVYAGPISREFFTKEPYTELKPLANLGRLAPIASILITILNIFYGIVGNYGIAILLLTLSVKLALHPLTAKGMRSMYAMQKIGPKLKQLKEKYGDDRQKFGMEQMKLFKEEGVNPMMGCLPMLLQMPVYIALYTTLTRVIEVRHAPFLWIDDLAKADALFSFGTTIPILGNTFNLLPLMWMTSMFFQQKMTPKSPDPNMAQQQKMMQFIPFVFGFMMYKMPAGLMLYWVAQNIFSIIEQARIRKKYMPKTS